LALTTLTVGDDVIAAQGDCSKVWVTDTKSTIITRLGHSRIFLRNNDNAFINRDERIHIGLHFVQINSKL
jgi:hypothetical protein